MADGGQPREATDAYLADLYPAAEHAALLDEIYGARLAGAGSRPSASDRKWHRDEV